MAQERALGALSLLAVTVMLVASSGCVNLGGGPAVTFDNGVAIQNFEPKLGSVFSGEDVLLQMRINNMGSFEAQGEASIDLPEWECTTPVGITFDLLAPDASRGTEGGEAVIRWTCKAPQIAEGLTVPYEARAQLEYPYRTASSKTVTLLPTSELIALNDAGEALPSEEETQSHSPVRIAISVKGPIRIREDRQVEFPVTFSITNVGGGIVKDSKVSFDVDKTGAIIPGTDCDQYSLPLWRGQSQTMTCEMTAGAVTSLTQARIAATAEYTYIVSSSARIEATGNSEAGGGTGCTGGKCY